MRPPEEISVGPIVLRRWDPAWAQATAEAIQASMAELHLFLPWAHEGYALDDSYDFIARSVKNWIEATEFNYAVFSPSGDVAGSAGLMTRMGAGVLEIGYWIHSHYTGMGYATAATAALAQLAITTLGCPRVVVKNDVANPASGRVAAKAGFTQVGQETVEPDAPGVAGIHLVWELRARA